MDCMFEDSEGAYNYVDGCTVTCDSMREVAVGMERGAVN
jgi:hypothetical protein